MNLWSEYPLQKKEPDVYKRQDVESADEVALPVESTGVRVGGSTDGRPGFGIGGGGSGIAGVGLSLIHISIRYAIRLLWNW